MFTLKYNIVTDNYYVEQENHTYSLSNKQDISSLLRLLNSDKSIPLKKECDELEMKNKHLFEVNLKKNARIHTLEKKIMDYEDKLNGVFPINAEPLKAPYRLDLRDYFKIPVEYTDKIWYEGDIINALKYYKTEEVILHDYMSVGDYQGEYFSSFEIKEYFFLWRGSFGSCSVCDMISGENIEGGYDALLTTLSEGNTLQFYSRIHALNYLEQLDKSNRYNYWKSFPKSLLKEV